LAQSDASLASNLISLYIRERLATLEAKFAARG
jgi:hypothetical protein